MNDTPRIEGWFCMTISLLIDNMLMSLAFFVMAIWLWWPAWSSGWDRLRGNNPDHEITTDHDVWPNDE